MVKSQVKSKGQNIFKSSLKSSCQVNNLIKSSQNISSQASSKVAGSRICSSQVSSKVTGSTYFQVKSQVKSQGQFFSSSQASSQVTGYRNWPSQASSQDAGQTFGQVKSRSSQVNRFFGQVIKLSHQVKRLTHPYLPPPNLIPKRNSAGAGICFCVLNTHSSY